MSIWLLPLLLVEQVEYSDIKQNDNQQDLTDTIQIAVPSAPDGVLFSQFTTLVDPQTKVSDSMRLGYVTEFSKVKLEQLIRGIPNDRSLNEYISSYPEQVQKFCLEVPRKKISTRIKQRKVKLSIEQRELLEADLMGLEDASAYLINQLTTSSSKERLLLTKQLKEKQLAIKNIKRKLSRKENTKTTVDKLSEKTIKKHLYALQNYRPDTIYVQGLEGHFMRLDTFNNVLELFASKDTNIVEGNKRLNSGKEYVLEVMQYPVLTAKSRKIMLDTISSRRAFTEGTILVRRVR